MENAIPKYDLDGVFQPTARNRYETHSILMNLVPEHSTVLEFGASSGYLSGYLEQSKGCRVTALEIDPVATTIAAARSTKVYTVDLNEPHVLDVVEDKFDVLLAPSVLEHLRDPQALLVAARSKLKPNAKVLVVLPNIAHYSIRLMLLRGKFTYRDYGIMDRTHLHFYTVKTARELIQQSGYLIHEMHIGGSQLQNTLSRVAQFLKQPAPKPVLPNLFGYEMIFVASPEPPASTP